jgi:hypothetical protein
VWAGGDASGIISVKNLYLALEKQLNLVSEFSWLIQLWNWKLPLKLKLFMWLAGKGKILTWDALRRRGWEGPGICSLCRHAQEDVSHILIHCDFSSEVWNRTLDYFKLSLSWKGVTLTDCFNSWLSKKSSPNALAVYVSWHLWIERNNALFEERTPSPLAVLHRVLISFNWKPSSLSLRSSKLLICICLQGILWRVLTERPSPQAVAVVLVVTSKLIQADSPSGTLTVVRELTIKLNYWVSGPPFGLLPCGRLITC